MLKARQLMDLRVPRVRADEPLAVCVRLLGPRRHLVVVGSEGALLGLVERDALVGAGSGAVVGELVSPARTVGPDDPAADALDALLDGDIEGLVVVDELQFPLGLVSLSDAVQVARFVLPPQLSVAQVMGAVTEPMATEHKGLYVSHEARQGADALAEAHNVALPVFAADGTLVGSFGSRDVVAVLVRFLRSPETVLVDPIP